VPAKIGQIAFGSLLDKWPEFWLIWGKERKNQPQRFILRGDRAALNVLPSADGDPLGSR
jgi:hypothetical protein